MTEFLSSTPAQDGPKPMFGPTNPIRSEFTDGSEVVVPTAAETPKASENEAGEAICPICEKVCKSDFGLQSHMRSHKK